MENAQVGGFYDVYVLSPQRTKDAVNRFLDRFAPQREQSASDFHIPQYSAAPAIVFENACDLIEYCVAHLHEPHAVYWRCLTTHDPDDVMVFFTSDAALILGLSVSDGGPRWLASLLEFTNSECGYVAFEQPPPDNVPEFLAMREQWGDCATGGQ